MEIFLEKQKIFSIIFFLFVFVVLSLPLLSLPPLFEPIDWGKIIVFRAIFFLLIIFFCYILLFRDKLEVFLTTSKEKFKKVFSLINLLGLFWGWNFLATIFSVDINNSLWGDPFRAGGFVNFTLYILFGLFIFLIVFSEKKWRNLWIFSFVIGHLVSLVAIFQQFGLFSKVLIPFETRPGSTLGNPIFLGIYLLLMAFLALGFGLTTSNLRARIFYFFTFFIYFLITFLIAQTRAGFIGFVLGGCWFFFGYPCIKKKIKNIKILGFFLILLFLLGGYYFYSYTQSHLYIFQKMPPIISSALDRILSIFEGIKVEPSRLSSWRVSLKALKEKPILGWGPENFSIAFNKHYDPALPKLGGDTSEEGAVEWWDRAHNIFFDISVPSGIPAFIFYFLFIGLLFLKLEKIKRKKDNFSILANALQASFIGYFSANIFSFDSFSSYVIFWLLVAYSFYLIYTYSSNSYYQREKKVETKKINISFLANKTIRQLIFIFLILFLVLLFYHSTYLPALANTNLNIANDYARINKCDKSISLILDAKKFKKTLIDGHLARGYALVAQSCLSGNPELGEVISNLLERSVKYQPNDVRNWLLLGESYNLIIEQKKEIKESGPEIQKLKEKADNAFKKALELNPKRQIIYQEWAKTAIFLKEYSKAEERLKKCLSLNENFSPCYWLLSLTYGYMGDTQNFHYFMKMSEQKGYDLYNKQALTNLANMYIETDNYEGLVDVYKKLIGITGDSKEKAQYYASLAFVYKKLGQRKKARESALKALDLYPEAKKDVELFLKSLE